MNKITVEFNNDLNEKVYMTKLANGLNVYICKKENFKRKIGMFGTKYGSLTNDFIDINTGKRVKVTDGIAHFLEHKLFEKEGDNALDLFSKMGVSSNAYTSFDHTVYYFDTTIKLNESIKMLIKLIKEPYFTDENVAKEQGIIAQEIMMYNDDPSYMTYFNAIKAMYNKNNIKVDILGTVETISKITKEDLYTCYNTFYNLNNMFFIVVGDVEVEETINLIEKELEKYSTEKRNIPEIQRFYEEESEEINKGRIIQNMDVFMPQICVGYKLKPKQGKDIIKRAIITDIISDMYFSRITEFYKKEYDNGVLTDKIYLSYEAEDTFAHLMFMSESLKLDELEKDLIEYINKIKIEKVDEKLFNQVKNNKIATMILNSDSISNSYRRIIDSILTNTNIYDDIIIAKEIALKDIQEFLSELDDKKRVVSIVKK